MSGYRIEKCRSCSAPVIWARHFRTGKSAPIDPEEKEGGNVALWPDEENDGAPWYSIPRKGALTGPLRTAHFATCPNAGEWRK